MKKIIALLIITSACLFSKGQTAYQGYLASLDTLTNADSHRDTVKVSGPKASLSFQVNVLKISGTVAGTVKLYGSVDGVSYGSAAIDSVTLADASGNYQLWRTIQNNPFSHYILVSATTGTSSASTRASMMWRKEP